MSALTARAKQFAAINRKWSIVYAAWLDKDRKHVTGPPETWIKQRIRFDNGQQITLHRDDLASLKDAGIKPVWYGDRIAARRGEIGPQQGGGE